MSYLSGISIVIAAEGRVQLTCNLIMRLDDLCHKVEFPTEVLVVDSSQGADRETISQTCKEFNAQWIAGPESVRKKRNIGIGKACFSIILFLDSDCLPEDGLLNQHWQVYHSQNAERLGGVLGRLEFTGQETFAWRLVKNSSLIQHFDQSSLPHVKWGPTANLSVAKAAVDEIGLFDETFPFKLGGDDLDLTYRLTKNGWLLISNPNALVYHDRSTWNSLKAVLSRAFRWGRMEYYLYKKHTSLQTPHPPSFFGWLFLVIGFSAVSSLILKNWRLLALPVGWIVLALIFFSLWISLAQKGSLNQRWRFFWESILTGIPELVYQFGSTWEFLKHGDLRFLLSRPLLSLTGISGIWAYEAWNTWSNLLAFLINYLAVMFWIRVL